jgi:uroporphyrin-III C-methyltransferase
MGVSGAATIQSALQQGLSGDTPVAIIQNASLPSQRHATATLATLHATLQSERLGSPSVIVVGNVLQGLQAASAADTTLALRSAQG